MIRKLSVLDRLNSISGIAWTGRGWVSTCRRFCHGVVGVCIIYIVSILYINILYISYILYYSHTCVNACITIITSLSMLSGPCSTSARVLWDKVRYFNLQIHSKRSVVKGTVKLSFRFFYDLQCLQNVGFQPGNCQKYKETWL